VSRVDVLKVEVGESVKRIASCLEPSDLQMHKMCANLMDGSVRLAMVVIKRGLCWDGVALMEVHSSCQIASMVRGRSSRGWGIDIGDDREIGTQIDFC
jgi:hypothetical protein